MIVRSKDPVFVGGRRLRVNEATGLTEPFNYEPKIRNGKARPLPDNYVLAESGAKAAAPLNETTSTSGMKRKDLMKALKDAGISFKATDATEHLASLLAQATKKMAPAASTAPSKENQHLNQSADAGKPTEQENAGTGNQEVL